VMAQRPAYQARFLDSINRDRLARLKAFASTGGKSQVALALGAVLAHTAVTAAAVGIQSTQELETLVAAVENPLDSETYRALLDVMA